MELSQFLARTVCPGGYFVIAYSKQPGSEDKSFGARLFQDGDTTGAAGFIDWCVRKGFEPYHAQGAYKMATARVDGQGRTVYDGSRRQDNVLSLRSFWVDLDCKRDGDKKKSDSVFADRRTAMAWLKQFCAATGMPLPNQLVNSGYGFHCYWLLEDPMLKHQWQVYADALKAALLANGFIGDSGISTDAARVLRPIGTNNLKSGQPVPVHIIPQLTRGFYPNSYILNLLQPYVGAVQAATGTGGVLGSGTVAPIFQNAQQAMPNMNAAAAQGIVRDTRPRFFQRIASECAQAKQSLAARGNGDPYPLWYLGFLGLLTFCEDAEAFITPMSDGDPRYTAANVDAHWQRAKTEKDSKGLGPPTCAMFDRGRPGVCHTCPHHTKIITPLSLGIKDGDLPSGYRREGGCIEERVFDRDAKEWVWRLLVEGDIHSPLVDEVSKKIWKLIFTYERAGRRYSIAVDTLTLVDDKLASYLNGSSMSIGRQQAGSMGRFLLAWINKLRDLRAERTERIHPFGWAFDPDGIIGFAYASRLYRSDGRVEMVPGCDQETQDMYEPLGKLAEWQKAAAFVCNNRVDLQAIVAASFGAPLMRFTGHKGVVIAAWSQESSRGKSSAMEVGRSVWGNFKSKSTMQDTPLSVMHRIGETRVMPCFWDEMRVGEEQTTSVVNMIFNIAEGKERQRMNANATLKPTAEWDTITICASNASILDMVSRQTQGTDAGALRVFEFEITAPASPQDPKASLIVALVKDHYGRAGEVYAAYLAANHAQVASYVEKMSVKVAQDLGATASERYYVAAISALLVGAGLASKLGLMKFDLLGLRDFLYHTFNELRAYRGSSMLISSAGTDYAQIAHLFIGDHLPGRIVTERFARQGQRSTVLYVANNLRKVDVHISVLEDVVRISRATFGEWCRKRSIQAKSITDLWIKHWGATQGRASMAGGTDYATGPIYTIDIPLSPKAMQVYRYVDPNAKPVKGVT